jgi:heavy metal sensor kinase
VNLPIRVRLTASYVALLAAMLAALGAFLVIQLRTDLYQDIDQGTTNGSTVIAEAIADTSEDLPAGGQDEVDELGDFEDTAQSVLPDSAAAAQLLSEQGRVILHHGGLAPTDPLVGPEVLSAARGGHQQVVTLRLGPERQRYRVLITALGPPSAPRFLVVALSLKRVDTDVRALVVLLLVGGPIALLVTALVGYWIARKALRPLEQMTSDAQAIRTDRLHERVAVPNPRDELRRLAETLNAMLDRIEQGSKQQRQLIADASHELRTPLAVMRTELDVSLRADELSPAALELLRSTREEVDQMSRTVDNLLTLAVVDEGRLELLTETMNLREAIDHAVTPLEHLAKDKNVRVDVVGDPWEVRADRLRMHLALGNLIGNAIKFTDAGGVVRVEAWRRGNEIGVTVTDDGPGVSAHDRDHLFDRFYRVQSTRGGNAGGSGLGLSICREVLTAHGGRVWVDSELGEGSAFSMALPGWRALPTEDGEASSTAPSGSPDDTRKR